MHQLHNKNCLEVLSAIPDKSIDLILQDPPYNTTACKWDFDILKQIDVFWTLWERVIKDTGAIIMTSTQPFTSKLVCSNLKLFKYEWIWVKSRAVGFPNAKNKPMNKHESVLVFSKADCANRCKLRMEYYPQDLILCNKRVSGIKACKADIGGHGFARPSHQSTRIQEYTNFPNTILNIPNEGGTVHPCQKPVALGKYLINTYTLPNETVFDGFMGSGSFGVAALQTGRNFIGCELDKKYFDIAQKRLDNDN